MICLAVLALAVAWVDPDDFEIAGTRYKTFPSMTAGSDVSYLIYLPPSYVAEPTRRFPVVYWLHRADGSQRTGAPFVALVDRAIRAGSLKPLMIVLVNGIRRSWYCDSADGSLPAESVIVRDLIPHIDARYRTIAEREARAVEGFSMGGFGAAHLGFKFPEIFGSVSVISTMMPGTDNFGAFPEFNPVFGGSAERAKENCPWELARRNAARLRGRTAIRLVTGAGESGADRLRRFFEHLKSLGIVAEYREVDEAQHVLSRLYTALGDEHTVTFYNRLGL
jgi:endo-1,4-beta-xylanase